MWASRSLRALTVLALGATAPMVVGAIATASPVFAADQSTALTPNGASVTLELTAGGATAAVMGLAGEQLTITTANGGFARNCDARLTLRAPDASVLAGPVCAGRHASVSVASLPVAGSYEVDLTTTAAAANLKLAATSSAGPASITPGAGALKVTWPPGTNEDFRFGFTAAANDIYSVVATGGGSRNPCQLVARFVDDTGNPVGTTAVPCAGHGGFIDRTTMPASGTYFVQLLGYTGRPLSVTLYRVVDQTAAVATDGTPADLTITTPGQQARFTFSATAGKKLSLLVHPDLLMSVYRPNGTLAFGDIPTFVDAHPLDTTGTWTAVVRAPTGAALPIDVTLSAYVFDDVSRTADLSGAPDNFSLVPGQRALYSFSGTAGMKVSAVVSKYHFGPCGPTRPLVALLRPDGSQASIGACTAKSKFIDAFTLDVSGTWSVVTDPSFTYAGSATIQVYDVVDATGAVTIDGPSVPVPISEPGQNAQFTFTAPNAHQNVSVSLTNVPSPACTVQLVKVGTGVVASAPCSVGSAVIGPRVIGAGDYEVMLDPVGPATGTATLQVSTAA